MIIGVFDSGIGGKSVADAISRAMPNETVIFENDSAHVPYGTRTKDDIYSLCLPVLQKLVDAGSDVLVIACNSVSVLLATELRKHFNLPIVALDPMVKPAAELSKSHTIAVCATPATLHSERYEYLKATYAGQCEVIEPDCSDWSAMIEHNEIDDSQIASRINAAIANGADVIVLGCTHYHWIEDRIKQIAGDGVLVLQPEQAIIARVKEVLAPLR